MDDGGGRKFALRIIPGLLLMLVGLAVGAFVSGLLTIADVGGRQPRACLGIAAHV